jgi:hypothetical protein
MHVVNRCILHFKLVCALIFTVESSYVFSSTPDQPHEVAEYCYCSKYLSSVPSIALSYETALDGQSMRVYS